MGHAEEIRFQIRVSGTTITYPKRVPVLTSYLQVLLSVRGLSDNCSLYNMHDKNIMHSNLEGPTTHAADVANRLV